MKKTQKAKPAADTPNRDEDPLALDVHRPRELPVDASAFRLAAEVSALLGRHHRQVNEIGAKHAAETQTAAKRLAKIARSTFHLRRRVAELRQESAGSKVEHWMEDIGILCERLHEEVAACRVDCRDPVGKMLTDELDKQVDVIEWRRIDAGEPGRIVETRDPIVTIDGRTILRGLVVATLPAQESEKNKREDANDVTE